MLTATNVDLKKYSTMRLGGTGAYMLEVENRSDLETAVSWAEDNKLPVIMIGGGSNIFWQDEGFAGLLVVNKIKRYEVLDEDGVNIYVTAGAGEAWDTVVERTAKSGLTGIEALSLIPGTAGATPVQNVGAYGQEIAQTLAVVEAYDRQEKKFVNLPASECAFGYRTSRFKTNDKGRFLISAITFHLMHENPKPPFYPSVEQYITSHGIASVTPLDVRQAVVEIRSNKLPDPAKVANNGSFFANPIIDYAAFAQIAAAYDTVPHWPASDGKTKLAAAWLLEQAGFKDYHDSETGMATWPAQPLVFVNEHARSTADLLRFKQKIADAVHNKFGIHLEQEPELLP